MEGSFTWTRQGVVIEVTQLPAERVGTGENPAIIPLPFMLVFDGGGERRFYKGPGVEGWRDPHVLEQYYTRATPVSPSA
jgi:hypothetical protein